MRESPKTLPPFVINLFFVIGLVSALSFRLLVGVKELRPELFRSVWYVGVIGYILFFSFRYSITRKRKKAIRDFDLISKVKQGGELSAADRQVVAYLLSSLEKSRENLNYLFIFATSGLAILFDLFY
ncbi:MAG: hypothetical protein U9R66_01885 [Thermodesulfobacteriota bacterium]|nr:hypothetical protein [Thermodesulfobacteriota bacterium]